MNITEQKKAEIEKSDSSTDDISQIDSVDDQDQIDSVDDSRRRFSRAGLAASGVLLTIASKAAFGGGGRGGWGGGGWDGGGGACKAPSGFLSGNLSTHGKPKTCSGRTPGYWCNKTDEWPTPYKAGGCNDDHKKQDYRSWSNIGSTSGTRYKDPALGFRCTGYGAKYEPYSMMQTMLLDGSKDPYQLGAHCVAALLNARKGWTPVLTESQIRNMFNEYASRGYFEPTAGIKWYGEDIVTYLKSTMAL